MSPLPLTDMSPKESEVSGSGISECAEAAPHHHLPPENLPEPEHLAESEDSEQNLSIEVAEEAAEIPAPPVVPAPVQWKPVKPIPEETFKYLVLTRYSARHRAFDEPMDGIVYGAVASLGFAALENLLYVGSGDLGTAVARAATAVPGHAFTGAIMGYYVGQARFGPLGSASGPLCCSLQRSISSARSRRI